ncbi:MAG TPA: GH3 auxin-responsive promoter family protein [Planctomycetaceae bacterium]|nr:GH3 auxin-responsive promoter family protein [Planctomycetaceae bacterium]
MDIAGWLRAAAGAIPRLCVGQQVRRFLRATADCRGQQREVLRRLMALNADSRFSLEHGLDRVRDAADFRRRLGVNDYEFFRPWIEQLKEGDFQSLLGSRNRLLMFSLTSGTTSQSKFIPITRQFLDDYRRGWQVWGLRTFDDHWGIFTRKIAQITSDYDRFRTPGGTPCGNISGLAATMQRPIVQTMYNVPAVVSRIPDSEAKYYTALRLAIADVHTAMVTTANPSTLIHLARMAEEVSDLLIRDIADGTLSSEYHVPTEIRRRLGWRTRRRNRRRARWLEDLRQRTGRFYPSDYWPELRVVAVWTGGSAAAYLPGMRQYYDGIPIRDHGLSASEGRMTIPFVDERPEGVLDVTTHYFEFIPEEAYGTPSPTVLEAHELEEGSCYYILLTTASGLYRYDICDVVRCTGFCGTTPVLEFLHKGSHIANLTGEKIAESQVVAAVCQCAERMHLRLRHFTVSPAWSDPPRYQLLVEELDLHSPREGRRLAQTVDRRLQELNCEYREKRTSGRLGGLEWLSVPAGTWKRLAADRVQSLGGSLEQYKHPCLVPEIDFAARLLAGGASRSPGAEAAAGRGVEAPETTGARADRTPALANVQSTRH